MIDKDFQQYLQSTGNEKKAETRKQACDRGDLGNEQSFVLEFECQIEVTKVNGKERKNCYVQDMNSTCDLCAIKEQRTSFLPNAPMSAF